LAGQKGRFDEARPREGAKEKKERAQKKKERAQKKKKRCLNDMLTLPPPAASFSPFLTLPQLALAVHHARFPPRSANTDIGINSSPATTQTYVSGGATNLASFQARFWVILSLCVSIYLSLPLSHHRSQEVSARHELPDVVRVDRGVFLEDVSQGPQLREPPRVVLEAGFAKHVFCC